MHTSTRMQQSVLNESGSGLTQLQKEEVWAGKRVHFMNDNKVSELPPSPNCPSLIELYLQWNYELTAIPPLFFQRIALLQVLDLSHTSIKCLPKSLPKLVALKKLLLRRCQLFMELSPLVGKLSNLEELDLDETQIMDMPREIGKLLKLRHLRVSFYQICGKKKSKLNIVIHPETISNLSQLTLLSIDVNPTDKRWDDSVEAVVKEVCNSKTLMTLSLYLPKFQLLDCISSLYPSLSGFRFIVGHHKRRIISRVPREVEAEFRNWDKCLKFVNGENIPIEIKGVLKYSTSFFLDQHATALNLSEFGIENMKRLKFCLLVDCNKMETIIDGERHYDGNEDDPAESDPSPVENVLESLEYLSIYYVENLESIWRGPYRYGCMSKLKFLALHACPQLINIFSHTLLGNFVNLEEFILEDCPLVTCLVSHASVKPTMSDKFLPSLTRLLLLYLPELVSISNGLLIAPKLETIGFYNCPKLKSISKMELSSKTLKIIKGELQWWEDMKWNEAEWGNQPDYLMRIFSPIDKEKDVMTQLAEDRDLFGVTKQNEGQQIGNCGSLLSDYTEERITETDVTKSTSSVCMLPSTPWTEAPKQAWSFSSVENKRIEDDCFDLASETSEVDDDEDEPKAKRWNCTENENKGVIGFASKIARGDRTEFRIKSNVDIVDDGYKWRKYGRKIIKGNPHPTNYYKCMTLGCPMRKRVVRDSQDTSFLVVTYEGIHNHEGPSVKALNNVGDAAEAAKTISPTKGYGDVLEASIQDTGLHPGIPEASIPDESQQSGVTMTENSNDPSARTLKQPRFVWSMELHWRFVDVVARLGIQEAVPKTIMQLMDVKGLTLKNVATHLKKYRIYLRMQELRNQGPSSFDQLLASKSVPQSLHEGGSGGGGGSVVGGGSANGDGHMGMAISMPSGAPMTPMPIPMYGNDQQGTISREENNASDVCHLPQPSPSTNSTTISQLSANTLPTARLQAPSFEEVAKQSQSKGNLQANYGNYYKKYSHFVKCRKSDDACTWRCYGIKGLTVNRRRSLYKCARPGCPVLEFLRKRKNMKTETNFTTTSLIANS